MTFSDYIKEEFNPLELLGIKELKNGLELEDIQKNSNWHWIVSAGIKNAIIGKKGNKLVWHDGVWVLGKWNEKFAIWKKGDWRGGTSSDGTPHSKGDSPNKW